MQHETLKASVQYGDYSGTVAADRHDQRDIEDIAKSMASTPNVILCLGSSAKLVKLAETNWQKPTSRFWPLTLRSYGHSASEQFSNGSMKMKACFHMSNSAWTPTLKKCSYHSNALSLCYPIITLNASTNTVLAQKIYDLRRRRTNRWTRAAGACFST